MGSPLTPLPARSDTKRVLRFLAPAICNPQDGLA